MDKYARKVDVLAKPESLADKLRKRRVDIESASGDYGDGGDTKTEQSLRRREDAGAYEGLDKEKTY